MNPFSGYGNVVEPDRFIGRKREIRDIEERILKNKAYGSVAIIGEARIGKTSLMNYSFSKEADALARDKKVVVSINSIARLNFTEPDEFFVYLIKMADKCLRRYSDYSAGSQCEAVISSKNFATLGLFEYLEAVKRSGFRLIFLLDEFDGIRQIFADAPNAFHSLREMGYNDKCKVAFVVTSRLGIEQIELSCTGISTLISIFTLINLGLMSEKDIRSLINARLNETNIHFTEEEIEEVLKVAGCYPFFVEMFCFHLFNEKLNDPDVPAKTQMERAINRARPEFFKNFDNFRTRLGEERFNHLLRYSSNPGGNVNCLNDFISLGHLIRDLDDRSSPRLRPFCEMYTQYLVQQEGYSPPPLIDTLSDREVEVLRLVALWKTNKEIADQLCVTENTVKTHAKNIFQKLEVTGRAEAVDRARELGLLKP